MKRRHYITAVLLLILPIVVIYALTNYGIESATLQEEGTSVSGDKSAYACQQKKLGNKEAKSLRLDKVSKRHLK